MATRPALRPTHEDELADIITDAARDGTPLMLAAGGTKSAIGAETAARAIDLTGFSGVVDYDPAELVLTVRAGTRLTDVEALVCEQGQMLAFEPFDHGPIFGIPVGLATIGGVIAAGVAGSQRLSSGGARDHLLGFRAVSGRGEPFVAGAKVVKNVTGYDLPKLATGSWGRLFAMTELTLKVLPRPREWVTLVLHGLDPARATAAMAAALGCPADVAAAAHIPAMLRSGPSLTAFRLQGFGPSVAARKTMLTARLASFGELVALDADDGTIWGDLASLRLLPVGRPLWRVNAPPSRGPEIAAAVEALGGDWLFDWAGGLVWIACDATPCLIREAAIQAGGHAMLIRASAAMRADTPAFHPLAPAISSLEARLRRAFDPSGVFETGRF